MLKDMLQLVETILECVLTATTYLCLADLFLAFDIMIYTAIHLLKIDGNASSQTILIMNLRNQKISQSQDLDSLLVPMGHQ